MADHPINLKLKATERVSRALSTVGQATTNLQQKMSLIQRRFQTFQRVTEESRKKLQKFGGTVKSIGTNVAAFASLPAAAGIGASVKAFASFENEITAVKTLLDNKSFKGATLSEGFERMKKSAQALAQTVPVDISLMNKALFDTVSAGVDASQSVRFVEQSARLAVAGMSEISTSTNGMTTALNAFQLKAEDAEKVAAKFFVAQKRGKTTITELSNDIGKVASTANALNISLEEVLAATAAASAGGIKTNEAFTSMKAVFANIIKPTTEATKLAKGLGVGFDSMTLRKKGIVKFFDDIIKSTKKVGGDPKRAFEILFGSTEALNLALSLTGSQAELFKNTLGELRDEVTAVATLEAAYREQSQTVENQTKKTANGFVVLGQKIGEILSPVVRSLTGRLSTLFATIANNPGLVRLAATFGVVVAALGPLLIAVGSFISILPFLKAGLVAVGITLGGLKAMLLTVALPVTLLTVAIGLLIYNWDKISDVILNFDEVITGVGLSIKEIFLEALEAIGPKLEWLSDKFSKFVNPIKNFFDGPLNMLFSAKGKVEGTSAGNDGSPAVKPVGPDQPAVFGKPVSFGAPKAINPNAPAVMSNKSESTITVDFRNLPQGAKVKTDKGGSDSLFINSGMQGAFGT